MGNFRPNYEGSTKIFQVIKRLVYTPHILLIKSMKLLAEPILLQLLLDRYQSSMAYELSLIKAKVVYSVNAEKCMSWLTFT